MEKTRFHKESPKNKVWWVERVPRLIGRLEISFDKKKIYNLWTDYHNLPKEEQEIFDKEEPFWKDFFSSHKD